MNRIDQVFEKARAQNRAALILYITSGFPDEATTRLLLPVLEEAGCDLVELGVPFSDPLADGPVIQHASTVALLNGMTFRKTLEVVRDFRKTSQMPVLLFGALNPFLKHGLEASAQSAVDVGADGFLAADLPSEEADEFRPLCEANDLVLVPLLGPGSDPDRVREITGNVRGGFLYCIAVAGITGAREGTQEGLEGWLDSVRNATDLPTAVGFGISKPEHVRKMRDHCDGIIIGSALIRLIEKHHPEGPEALATAVGNYVRTIAKELHR